jgi:hypothetical protein
MPPFGIMNVSKKIVKYYQYNSMHYNSVFNYTLLKNTTLGGHQVIIFFNMDNSDIANGHA